MPEYYSCLNDFKDSNGYIIDDVWYPRVTRIVSIKAKPALAKFYNEVGGYENGQAIAQKSAEEGTRIHEAVEAILLGHKIEEDDSIAPSIRAFREFLGKTKIETSPEYVERRVRHPDHRYAGTVDALARIGGKFGVLDIKTSQSIYRDYNLQTSAYMDALQSSFPDLETRWILRIDQVQICRFCRATRRMKGGREKIRTKYSPYGTCKQHEWLPMEGQVELQEFPFWQGDFQAFLGAKRLWEWENEDWLKRLGYL
jgi:hypothetical protein